MANDLTTVTLDLMIDKHIGKPGTSKRAMFEKELRASLDFAFKHGSTENVFRFIIDLRLQQKGQNVSLQKEEKRNVFNVGRSGCIQG